MNMQEIYDKVKNPPSDEEKAERDHLESIKSIARQQEESERELWLQTERTKHFIEELELHIRAIQNSLIDSSLSSSEIFGEMGRTKAHEAYVLKKVLNYARTGKYQTEY